MWLAGRSANSVQADPLVSPSEMGAYDPLAAAGRRPSTDCLTREQQWTIAAPHGDHRNAGPDRILVPTMKAKESGK